ncbi:MAG: photosynthetic complex putative assembly protein PuhB [Wenzhouxiangella sp.]|nr:photosynthetic complex putative assembly protein PuhB [Wenzhouxiangella sp.]
MSDIRIKELKPLPETLPEDERVLWQHSPEWRPYGRRVFQLGKIALYFLVVVAWVAVAAYIDNGGWQALVRSLIWSVPPAIGVIGLLALVAWLYARTTVYTITSKRVIIQSGLAVPSAVNLPFTKVQSADMKTYADRTGDIELAMSGPRLLYSMLWPNVRFFRLKRPLPVMRAIPQPEAVAEILGQALADDQQPAEAPQKVSDKQGAKQMRPEMQRATSS